MAAMMRLALAAALVAAVCSTFKPRGGLDLDIGVDKFDFGDDGIDFGVDSFSLYYSDLFRGCRSKHGDDMYACDKVKKVPVVDKVKGTHKPKEGGKVIPEENKGHKKGGYGHPKGKEELAGKPKPHPVKKPVVKNKY